MSPLGGNADDDEMMPVRRRRKGTSLEQLEKRVRRRKATSTGKGVLMVIGNIMRNSGSAMRKMNQEMAKQTRNMPTDTQINKEIWR
jgi:hypothetical protein